MLVKRNRAIRRNLRAEGSAVAGRGNGVLSAFRFRSSDLTLRMILRSSDSGCAWLRDLWPLVSKNAPRDHRAGGAQRSRRGQRHLPGRWWSATDGGHVGYESWLERDHVMLLYFDPTVVGIASQPFRLSWTAADGRSRSHVPDYFARWADGSAVVVDCRPVDRRDRPRDVAAFEASPRACPEVGWEYRLVGAPDSIMVGNVRWLSHRVRQIDLNRSAINRSDQHDGSQLKRWEHPPPQTDGTLIVPSAIRWRSPDLVGGAGGGVQL